MNRSLPFRAKTAQLSCRKTGDIGEGSGVEAESFIVSMVTGYFIEACGQFSVNKHMVLVALLDESPPIPAGEHGRPHCIIRSVGGAIDHESATAALQGTKRRYRRGSFAKATRTDSRRRRTGRKFCHQ